MDFETFICLLVHQNDTSVQFIKVFYSFRLFQSSNKDFMKFTSTHTAIIHEFSLNKKFKNLSDIPIRMNYNCIELKTDT